MTICVFKRNLEQGFPISAYALKVYWYKASLIQIIDNYKKVKAPKLIFIILRNRNGKRNDKKKQNFSEGKKL